MIKNRYINVICIFIVIVTLSVSVLFMYSPNFGVVKSQKTPEYATLFSTDKVHEIDIQINESTWNDMLENAINEEYVQANVVIDGQTVSGIGIRPKGNSSLSTIVRSDSDRYSFKVEFDHYSNKINYKGLDMLVLNNISQDNTYMKDYVCYQMMNEMGAIAPLSSFINVKVNGEDWGLYLAAEGIGESFAQRVYGNNFGEIYKPDTDEMGAEKIGNQVNNIDAEKIGNQANNKESTINKPDVDGQQPANIEGGMPDMSKFVDENGKVDMQKAMEAAQNGGLGKDMKEMATGGARGGFGGRNSSVTSLVYVDDDSDSYSAIFDNAVFNTSNADKKRLITAIKKLNEREDIENVVDVDEVIRYFVVHNFVLNSDSYTGSIIHNYYLSEKDGQLSMIAWDYNLAFGGMGAGMMGAGRKTNADNANISNDTTNSDDTNNSVKTDTVTIDNATTLVNYPIDTPLLSGSIEDRPMLSWIFSSEEYTNLYHEVYSEYMEYFSSGKFEEMYDNAINLISEYVKNDPTAFCSYEEFQKGSSELKKFCLLRAESISSQLNGKIASTTEEQSDTNNANFVLASDIDIQSMGTNNMGGGMERGGRIPVGNFGTQNLENQNTTNSNTNNIDIENESSENTSNTNDTNMQNRLNENDSNTNDINMQNRLNENTSNTNDANMQNKLNENTSNTEDVINTNENTENGDYSTEAIGQDRVWSRERNNIQGGFPNMNSSESNTSNNKNTIILLISSIVILIGGIVFVKKKY